MIGTVIKVKENDGYAFVRGENGLSHFIHISFMENQRDFDRLKPGVKVIFDSHEDELKRGNGLQARNVKIGDAE